MKKKSNAGRPGRVETSERVRYTIKVTPDEAKRVAEMAAEFGGNVNKLFRVRILGEKK